MKIFYLFVAMVCALPTLSFAQQNNVGSCGLGSHLFNKQRGIVPQVLAVTTNGSSGSQTFGITSGTSGCTQDGLVTSAWRTAMFVDSNMNKLAQNMAVGRGEAFVSLARLLEIEEADRQEFYSETQGSFTRVFTSPGVTSQEVVVNLRNVLAANSRLERYSANL